MYTHNASYMKKKIFIISSLTSFSTAVRKNTCQKYFLCPLRPNIIIPTATSYSYIVCSYYVCSSICDFKACKFQFRKWRTTLYYITYVVKKRSRVCSSGLVWHPTVLYGLLLVVCVSLLFPLDPALHSPLHTRYICCAIVGLAVKRSSFLLFQAYCASLPGLPVCLPARCYCLHQAKPSRPRAQLRFPSCSQGCLAANLSYRPAGALHMPASRSFGLDALVLAFPTLWLSIQQH